MTLSKALLALAFVTATVAPAIAQAPQSGDPFVIRMLVDARKSTRNPHLGWVVYAVPPNLWESKEACELDMTKSREIRSNILNFAASEIQEHGEDGVIFSKPECVEGSVYEADAKKLAHDTAGEGV